MADFKRAFEYTGQNEAGYSNNPNDEGGETYKGIARRYHPNWPGWSIIDREKIQRNVLNDAELTQILEAIPELQMMVEEFFRGQFWNPILGDEIPNDSIAIALYDCAVNHGASDGIRWLQEGLNSLNNNGRHYADMPVDGRIGSSTISTLRRYNSLFPDNAGDLIAAMMGLRIAYYIELMKQKPKQETFARGWLRRAAKIIKDFC
jgi:lysozyme family protein